MMYLRGEMMTENMYLDRITEENFGLHSLDDFERHQVVQECWRRVGGAWTLVPMPFVEKWSTERKREVASELLACVRAGGMAWMICRDDRVVGFASVGGGCFGSRQQYVQLELLQVSAEARRTGVGRALFRQACEHARELGAASLYISAHSSRESAAFYRAMGCIDAREIDERLASEEPFDLQLECPL